MTGSATIDGAAHLEWLRSRRSVRAFESRPVAREVLSPETIARQGFFRPEAVTAVLERHLSRREDIRKHSGIAAGDQKQLDRL